MELDWVKQALSLMAVLWVLMVIVHDSLSGSVTVSQYATIPSLIQQRLFVGLA